jgi:dTDP-4-dehydrorhamnose reductase
MRILFVGGGSKLAGVLASAHISRGDDVLRTTRRTTAPYFLDLARSPFAWEGPSDFDVVYLTGGITSLNECEARPKETAAINVEGTAAAAEYFADRGAHLIFFSTNLVFDGSQPYRAPDAPRSPRCEYGRQKEAMEEILIERGLSASIVRLTKVLDHCQPLFTEWRRSLLAGNPISPFSDMVMAPIGLTTVTTASLALASRRERQIFQLSAAEDVTYAAAGRHLAILLGVSETLVQPVLARSVLGNQRHIPQHTTLRPPTDSTVCATVPSAFEAVTEFVNQPACINER